MGPEYDLPLPSGYESVFEYVEDLLQFVATSDLLQLLCGGVHIIDFFTRTPDLYGWLLPEEWRVYFEQHELSDLLDLFLREDLSALVSENAQEKQWRGKSLPPASLISYLLKIHSLSLRRNFEPSNIRTANYGLLVGPGKSTIPRHVAVGMNEKKTHEVGHFARYIHKLTGDVAAYTGRDITHIVDFGSGQNYLGRTLASPPYNKRVIAVESRHANVEGAKAMDVHARLAPKTGIWRNKKEWRLQQQQEQEKFEKCLADSCSKNAIDNPSSEGSRKDTTFKSNVTLRVEDELSGKKISFTVDQPAPGHDSIQYVEHRLEDGNLESVIEKSIGRNNVNSEPNGSSNHHLPGNSSPQDSNPKPPNIMVISLHSCGNLTHHGLRSLTLNPSVSAIALVGCCYNLVTERLTPPSYKLPNLRPPQAPLKSSADLPSSQSPSDEAPFPSNDAPANEAQTVESGDPHGFPMSTRVTASGINLNITARMMAVQAPHNWSEEDSARFFTRHFFRALLQKIFVDRGVVEPPPDTPDMSPDEMYASFVSGAQSNVAAITSRGGNWRHRGGATQPVIIGSLRKLCYKDFVSYVRGAVDKLASPGGNEDVADLVREKMVGMPEADIRAYSEAYAGREKDLSIVWSLMALSATLVEAVIIVDRWLWLREQMVDGGEQSVTNEKEGKYSPHTQSNSDPEQIYNGGVSRAWVESVFDYAWSPRNLVVVGVKKP